MKYSEADPPSGVRLALAREAVRDWWNTGGVWRWSGRMVGAGLVGLWIWLLWGTVGGESGGIGGDMEAAATMGRTLGVGLLAFACLICGAVLLAPALVPWVAAPFLRFIDSIYIGGHEVERPALTYDVAERRVREGRWQDAAAEFERIAYWHPAEERAWNEAIRCSILAGDAAGAEWLRRRARLRCPGMRRPPAGG